MSDTVIPIEEFDLEMKTTRRLMERVPTEHGEWKPHEKSFALGHLAQLVAWLPGWIGGTLRENELDFATANFEYSFEPTEALLEVLDQQIRQSRVALQEVTGEDRDATWTLRMGEQVLYSAPRRVAARYHLNHLIHHRGQLTVYLRLLDVPLPPIYGPTADER